MTVKVKYLKRPHPTKKDEPELWYASPMTTKAESLKSMTKAATENTSIAPTEMEAAITLWGNYASKRLLAGETVRVGDLGTMRLTFRSKGVESIDDVNAGQMIYDVRLKFTPSKEFRENIINRVSFECGGVLEDDVNYASLQAYRIAKGLASPDAGETGQGGTGGSGEEGEEGTYG